MKSRGMCRQSSVIAALATLTSTLASITSLSSMPTLAATLQSSLLSKSLPIMMQPIAVSSRPQHYCDKYNIDHIWAMRGTGTQASIWIFDIRIGFCVTYFPKEDGVDSFTFAHDIDPIGPDGHRLIHCLRYIQSHPVPDIRLDDAVLPLEPGSDIDTPQDVPHLTAAWITSFLDNDNAPLAEDFASDSPSIIAEAEEQENSPSPDNPGPATTDLPPAPSHSQGAPNLDTPRSSEIDTTTTSTSTGDGPSILSKTPSDGTTITNITNNNFYLCDANDCKKKVITINNLHFNNYGAKDRTETFPAVINVNFSINGDDDDNNDRSRRPSSVTQDKHPVEEEPVEKDEADSSPGSPTPVARSERRSSGSRFTHRPSVARPAPASAHTHWYWHGASHSEYHDHGVYFDHEYAETEKVQARSKKTTPKPKQAQ